MITRQEILGNRKISAVKQCKPLRSSQSKKNIFSEFPRVSPGDQPRPKEPKDTGYEIPEIEICERFFDCLPHSEIATFCHRNLALKNSNIPESLLTTNLLAKEPEDSGYEIADQGARASAADRKDHEVSERERIFFSTDLHTNVR